MGGLEALAAYLQLWHATYAERGHLCARLVERVRLFAEQHGQVVGFRFPSFRVAGLLGGFALPFVVGGEHGHLVAVEERPLPQQVQFVYLEGAGSLVLERVVRDEGLLESR